MFARYEVKARANFRDLLQANPTYKHSIDEMGVNAMSYGDQWRVCH